MYVDKNYIKIPETIDKANIDTILNDLAKELKKEFGKFMQFEIIIVGGASIVLNYDFRDATRDVDCIVSPPTSINDAINRTGDKNGLENGWLNSDFKKTASYSPKIIQYSKYYKQFQHILTVRTIADEYLIAMKLASIREYKHDKSDIVGILISNTSIDMNKINKAVDDLYDGWNNMPNGAKKFVTTVLENRTNNIYESVKYEENQNKKSLQQFEQEYKNVLNADNISDILAAITKKEQNDKNQNDTDYDEINL